MFQISTRFRYGLRAIAFLAGYDPSQTVNLHFIAEKENISRKYLENIFKLLKKGQIVRSVRGREGGYALVRKAENITLYEIMTAIEGHVTLVDCVENSDICKRNKDCGVRFFWKDYQEYIGEYLKRMTLQTFMDKYLAIDNENDKNKWV